MLRLHSTTSPLWFNRVRDNLHDLLVDHAHCEKKAAGTAMNLIFHYVDNEELCRDMTEIVQEELSHFHMVRDLLNRRGLAFKRLPPCNYGAQLHGLIRKNEPGRAVDRLLVAGLIEARSCERFSLLRDRLEDHELSDFYGGLFESEARHHATYVRLAKMYATEEAVNLRLDELAEMEANIIAVGDVRPRMHS